MAARIPGQPLELTDVLELALQIAAALEEAHGKAIIHRDINPANVMLTPHGRDQGARLRAGEGEVGGAGTAARHRERGRPRGWSWGPRRDMSPEQARGEEVDHRSDIFSFGAVLYEMATGRAAFKGPSQAETMNAVINVPHTPAREVRKDVPPQLAALIDRALMKEPRSRYQTMTELLGELRRVAHPLSETPAACQTSGLGDSPLRLWPVKPSTRLLASAVLVMLVAGVVYAVIQLTERLDAVRPPPQPALMRLTFDEGLQGEPTWSPDGRFIAYSSDKSGNFDIWVQPVGGGDAVQVTKAPAHEGSRTGRRTNQFVLFRA